MLSRVARERYGLVETTLAQSRGMQRHRHEQARQRRCAFARRPAPAARRARAHSRYTPVVLELPDQIVDRGRVTQRDQVEVARVQPWQVRVADRAQIEVERRAPETAQAARGGNSVAASSRASARGDRQPETRPLVDNGFRGSRTCPEFYGRGLGRQPEN